MKAFVACSAWAMLVAAWPHHAAAQGYTFVFETYRAFTENDGRAFHNWLADNDKSGRFDKSFYACLTLREQSWAANGRQSVCEAYPPGSVEKANCYGQNPEAYLIRWSRSLRPTLAGKIQWPDTEIGREIGDGERLCGQFLPPEVCEQFRGLNRQDLQRVYPLLVCR